MFIIKSAINISTHHIDLRAVDLPEAVVVSCMASLVAEVLVVTNVEDCCRLAGSQELVDSEGVGGAAGGGDDPHLDLEEVLGHDGDQAHVVRVLAVSQVLLLESLHLGHLAPEDVPEPVDLQQYQGAYS